MQKLVIDSRDKCELNL